MAIQKRGGHVSFRRPGIEPQLGKLLSRLALGVPSITQGSQFPQGPQFGDMHYYTGSTNDEYTEGNWYAYTPEGSWDSMNATNTEGKNITGDIPSGVTIADYLSKYGDTMEGEITFSDDQTLPAGKLVGDIPSGVRIKDYLPIAGGQLLGNLIMSRSNITRLGYLTGYDDNIKIDIGTDGEMSLSADSLIKLQATTLQLIGTLVLTGNITLTGDLTMTGDVDVTGGITASGLLVSSNIESGAALDQDCTEGASPNLDGDNFSDYNIITHDGEVVVHNGEVIHS